MSYVKTGICIWCGRSVHEGASFMNIPHILPKGLGGKETCVDVCDDCNSYFGTARDGDRLSCDHAVKEVLQLCRLFLLGGESKRKFSSSLFHSRNGKFKKKLNFAFSSQYITRQFKRGICEAVLQKYHDLTGKGNDKRFDELRRFARYNEGDIIFLYTMNRIVLTLQEPIPPAVLMGEEDIKKIDEQGLFTMHIYGLILTIVLIPSIPIERIKEYIKYTCNTLFSEGISIKQGILHDINELDLMYSRFHNFQLAVDEKDNIILPSVKKPSKD